MFVPKLKRLIGLNSKSVIQTANNQDYSALSEIHAASFSRGWSDGEFEALLAQDTYFCLVARKPGNIEKPPAGFVMVKEILDEAEIISIATKPYARRKGVAKQLMAAVIRKLQADRVSQLFLEVDTNNKPAIRLYKNLGFVEVSSRESYYSASLDDPNKPSTALVMQLQLG